MCAVESRTIVGGGGYSAIASQSLQRILLIVTKNWEGFKTVLNPSHPTGISIPGDIRVTPTEIPTPKVQNVGDFWGLELLLCQQLNNNNNGFLRLSKL